uniref:Uncharacterized protein n=1 Tax=Arundo donax TaxID=35708 RepID=A0A0A9H4A8_ARUDO
MSSNDHISKHTIRADGIASLKKLSASRKASVENPVHVSLHSLDTLTYTASIPTFTQ